jgi:hypothetical protein
VPPVRRTALERIRLRGARVGLRPGAQRHRFQVEFAGQEVDFASFVDFKEALEAVLDRRIDLVDRKAIEVSRNYIRRQFVAA